jgi:hypothetical protein
MRLVLAALILTAGIALNLWWNTPLVCFHFGWWC